MVYPGSCCSPAAAAFLITQKYVMRSPFYRIEQELELSRQTISNCVMYCAETWLITLSEALRRQLLQAEIINVDETGLQVLKEPGRNAQTKELYVALPNR